MNRPRPPDSLLAALQEFGIRAHSFPTTEDLVGFPVKIDLGSGQFLLLDLDSPFGEQAPSFERFGIAIIDSLGFVRKRWGLAESIPSLNEEASTLFGEMGLWVQQAICGQSASGYRDGFRFFLSPLDPGSKRVWLVVMDAATEQTAIHDANLYLLESAALKRLGRALNLNLSMDSLCHAAVHELSSVGRLAAVVLWVCQATGPELDLRACTGLNRAGTQTFAKLAVDGSMACLAEFVALSHKPIYVADASNHMLTSSIESKICYLQPGAVALWPLVSGGQLMGVLETVGRAGDSRFEELMDTFETFAEHLALALSSALLYEAAQRRANYDSLTDIANHRALQEYLLSRLAEAERLGSPLGFLLLDVDHFRSFNEEEGHQTGDEVLRLVAKTMSSVLRPYDLAARYGGEEFAVVLPNTDAEATVQIAERIRAGIEAQPFVTHSGRSRYVTVSIGVAHYPGDGRDNAGLIRAADQALYAAKRGGRNQIQQFDGEAMRTQEPLPAIWEEISSLLAESETGHGADKNLMVDPWIQGACEAFRLSNSQGELLRAALAVCEVYEKSVAEQNFEWLEAWNRSSVHRLLEPILLAYRERFDGTGPRRLVGQQIPLLARIMAGLRDLTESGGLTAVEHPERLDPEVLEWMLRLESAA